MNPKTAANTHITVKMLKAKDKENFFKLMRKN